MVNIEDLDEVLIVGAGTMGHSIAQVFAQAGLHVELVDISQEKLKHALELIQSNLEILAEFKRVDANQISNILSRIHVSTDLAQAAKNKLYVLEAVSEVPELKEQIFKKFAQYCSDEAILASNTSSLDIFKLVKRIVNLERVIGHHWFAPPHIIPSVEVIPGRKTSQETTEFLISLSEKVGKIPIVAKKFTPSYIVNKIQKSISASMYELMARGVATAEQIDLAIKTTLGIRLPIVGVVQLHDFTGLDVVQNIQSEKGGSLPIVDNKVEKNHLGVKTGRGFYEYGELTEKEILNKRDRLLLQQLEFLENLTNFRPI
jgi:3-hydroxybutyryl-CoA dehydrogenase